MSTGSDIKEEGHQRTEQGEGRQLSSIKYIVSDNM